MKFDISKIRNIPSDKLKDLSRLVLKSSAVLFGGYILAVFTSSVVMTFFIDSAMTVPRAPKPVTRGEAITKLINYHSFQKQVRKRNIFNSEGKFPDETDPSGGSDNLAKSEFDENAACAKTNLGLELLGTIYLGRSRNSLATIKEKGLSQADIYREGDVILGNENAKIYRIEQKKVVINNDGRKECLEMAPPKLPERDVASTYSAPPTATETNAPAGCDGIVLDEGYVSKQLGDDYVEILSKGRLIPHNKDNQFMGFKLIGMNSKSLWGKICLKNGDVLTQVNDISLQQPDKGFAVYEALQNESEIRISLLRNGTNPMTVNIQIK